MKTINVLWSLSLICIGVSAVIIAAVNHTGFDMPDLTTRLCGLICLVALPVLVYTSVRKLRNRRQ